MRALDIDEVEEPFDPGGRRCAYMGPSPCAIECVRAPVSLRQDTTLRT
jgi:hypothetical protein